MSREDWKWEQLTQNKPIFSWWYVDNIQDIDMNPEYSPYMRNARIRWGSVWQRPWHILLTEALTSWDHPRGIASYLRVDSSNDVMVVRHNISWTKKLYTLTEDWTLTEITTWANIASDNRMSFQNIEDVLYCMNWVDNFWKLDWTTYSTPSTWITNFAPAFSVVFNGSHFASWRATNANIVYKSVADNYEDFASSGSDTLTFKETITGLAVWWEALYYFTKNNVAVTGKWDIQEVSGALSYITTPLDVSEWAVNHACITSSKSRVYYVTPSNKIMYIQPWVNYLGKDSIPLSHRENAWIDNIMATLSKNQNDCYSCYLPDVNLIKFFFKSEWSDIHDICIVYDETSDCFVPDTNKYFYDSVHFAGKNYAVSMIEPKVYQDEYGNDDEDSPIPFVYYTKKFYFGWGTWKSCYWESRTLVEMNELAELTQSIWIDWQEADSTQVLGIDYISNEWWVWVSEIWTEYIWWWWEDIDTTEVSVIRTPNNLNKRWKTIQRRFENTTVGSKLLLKRLWVYVEQLPWLANSL